MNIGMKSTALPLMLLMALPLLSGCARPDVDLMTAGLIKSGIPADQADCFAEQMKKEVKADPYNYMAKMMSAGLSEREAVNKARRKYGAEFKAGMQDAREACVE